MKPGSNSIDDTFGCIANARRRYVVLAVANGGETDVDTVATLLGAVENDTSPGLLDSTQRQRVYIALYQSHLGYLDTVGLIDYDRRPGTMAPTEHTDDVAGYVERGMQLFKADPWRSWDEYVEYRERVWGGDGGEDGDVEESSAVRRVLETIVPIAYPGIELK